MSERKVKDNEKSNGSDSKGNLNKVPTLPPGWKGEMSREQALAVAWEALAVLALNGQVRYFNNPANDSLHVVISKAKVEVLATGGKKKLKLVDLMESANASTANT
jgi:hypothetical protein